MTAPIAEIEKRDADWKAREARGVRLADTEAQEDRACLLQALAASQARVKELEVQVGIETVNKHNAAYYYAYKQGVEDAENAAGNARGYDRLNLHANIIKAIRSLPNQPDACDKRIANG